MSSNRIVVTTPTGNIGSVVVERLLASGTADVAVIARKPEKLSEAVRSRVTVFQGDQDDVELVKRATEGATALFWLTPPNYQAQDWRGVYVRSGEVAAEAIRANGIPHVLHLSSAGADRAEGWGPVSYLHLVEKSIDGAGAHVLHLRPGYFYENWLTQVAPMVAQGQAFFPFGPETATPQIATRDIGAVAAQKLLSRDWSGAGNVLGLHGPAEQPTFGESARILGEVIGRPVELVALPMEAWKQGLLGMGLPQAIADGYEELMGAIGRGEKPAEERTAETTTPTTFREWAGQVVRPAADAFGASAPGAAKA